MIKEILQNKKYKTYMVLVLVTSLLFFIAFNVVKEGPYLLKMLGGTILNFLDIISPVFWAFIVAYLLYAPMRFIEKGILKLLGDRKKIKTEARVRLVSVALTFLIVIGLVIGIINFIVPPLITNVNILLSSIPKFEANISQWVNEISGYLASINIAGTGGMEIVSEISVALKTIGEGIIGLTTKLVGDISSFVIDFIVTVILSFYFMKDKEKLFRAVDKFGTIVCSSRVKSGIKGFIRDLDDIVGKFLIGTVFASFVVGVISTILMVIIGHPFAVLIGVAAGLTNVIPYVGPIIGAGLAFTLGVFESVNMGIWGAALLLIYQQVDGNVIQPKIVGDKVGLAPVWILIAVLIGGSYFGGVGMILAVPTAALTAVYIERRYQKVKDKKENHK